MIDATMTTTAAPTVCAADVFSVELDCVRLRLSEPPRSLVRARMALAFPYTPCPGDTVLVIGQRDRYYVIGVLAGNGRVDLALEGDVAIRSRGGELSLSGDKGVRVAGPTVTVRTGALKTFADSLNEKVGTAFRWCRELLTVRAGSSRRVIEGEDYTQSKRSVTLSEGTIKIDGNQIHLGH